MISISNSKRRNFVMFLTAAAVTLAAGLGIVSNRPGAHGTHAKIAVPDTVNIIETTDLIIYAGQSNSAANFTSNCMSNAGFSGNHPVYPLIVIGTAIPPGATRVTTAASQTSQTPGTRLSSLVLNATCVDGGIIWNVYEGDVN